MSFEYGRKNPLENNWYVEPQAQLQYTYLASTDYRTSQSTDVQLSGTDSLIGRVGFRIGRELDDKTASMLTLMLTMNFWVIRIFLPAIGPAL